MIRRLVLTSFGKFRDTTFDLTELTVFYGPNESGKTTIGDAFLDALCRPPGNRKSGQSLAARYGEARDARVEPEPASEERIEAEEFQSLLAVSSGDLGMQLPKGAPWLDALKAQLFTGGVDPRVVAAALERDAKAGKSTVAGKRLAEAVAARERARETLGQLKNERAGHLGQEKRLAESTSRLARLVADLERRKTEGATLTRELKQQGLIAQRRRCMDALRVLEEAAAVDAGLERTSSVAADEIAEMERLESAAAELSEEARSARQAADHARERLTEALAALASSAPQTDTSRAQLAALLEARLAAAPAATGVLPPGRRRGPVALAAGLALVVGGALAFALLPTPVSFVVGGIALALALPALLLGRGGARVDPAAARARAEEAARAEWTRVAGTPLEGSVVEALVRERLGHDTRKAERARLERQAEDLRVAVEARRLEAERAGAAASRASSELATFLQARGVSGTREYIAARARRAREVEAKRGLDETLAGLIAEYAVTGRDELGRECRVRIHNLDEEITSGDLDDPSRRRKEARLREVEGEIRDLTVKWTALSTEVSRERGRIQGSLGNLPERIRAAEQDVERLTAETREMEIDRKAAGVAAELLGSIAVDTDNRLDGLAAEIGELYRGIVGGEARADGVVTLDSLDLEGATARDAVGVLQSYGHLSQGTRDAMALAARLALAAKTGRKAGILVLDEPFLALDGERVTGALRALRVFRQREGWQVVILTKDPGLVESSRAVFGGDVTVHALTRGTGGA